MINETINQTLISQTTSSLNLWTLWLLFIISFPIVVLLYKSKKSSWGNFWVAWVFCAIISGIFVIFLTYSPDGLHNFLIKLNY
jgi:ABC-type sulfate transport system permease component